MKYDKAGPYAGPSARQAFRVLDDKDAVYTARDETALSRQIRRSYIASGVFAAVMLAALVPTLIMRLQWASMAVTVVLGAVGIFLWGMKVTPVLSFRKHAREIHSGLSRHVEGRLERVDEQITFREGINCYAFVVNVGDDPLHADPKDERLLYWNANKAMPDWKTGDRLTITAHGNDVVALRVTPGGGLS